MNNAKEGSAANGDYRMMRYLGTVTGSICRGFFFVTPFREARTVQDDDTDEVDVFVEPTDEFDAEEVGLYDSMTEPGPETECESDVDEDIEIEDEVQQEADVDEELEYVPEDPDDILSGLVFESAVQRMEAEMCVTDCRSKLATVRKDALGRIRELPRNIAIKILQRLLSECQDSLGVIQVLNALSALNDDSGLEKELFMNFLDDESPTVRLAALGAISQYRDEESLYVLSASLEDPDARVRRHTLNLLSWGHESDSASSALTMLHDVDDHVRRTAIYLCASLKLREAISPLISFLSDPKKDIQECSSESLRKITGQDIAFNVSASAKRRNEAIEAWRLWWRSNQATFET